MDFSQKIEIYLKRANWNDALAMNVLFKELRDEYDQDRNFPYREVLDRIEKIDFTAASTYFPKGRQRRDGRSLGEFGIDIFGGHCLERRTKDVWMQHYGQEYLGGRDLIKYGVDDSGALLIKVRGVKIEKPDCKFNDPHPVYGNFLELKTNKYCEWKSTFKIINLREYVRSQSSILSVYLQRGDLKVFALISPVEVETILTKTDHFEIRKEIGGKEAIQFHWALSDDEVKEKRKQGVLSHLSLPLDDYCAVVKRHEGN